MVPMRTVLASLLAASALAGCNNGPSEAPSITNFTCLPGILPFGGGSVTIKWMVSGATNVSINGEAVSPASGGSVSYQVTAPMTFTLLATNFAGQSTAMCQVTVGIPPPVINSFTAMPTNLPVGGGSVTLSWNITWYATTDLSLTIEPAPPAPVSIPANDTEVTFLVGSTTTFTLTATNSTGSSMQMLTVTVTPPPITLDVNGVVVDDNGQPIAGETVVINSDAGTQTALSDINGAFSASNVETPYSATIVESTQSVEYQGLTRPDPSLTAFVYLAENRSAALSGHFTGGHYPEGTSYNTVFLFSSPQVTQNLMDQPSGSYSTTVTWAGAASTTGTLYALQIENASPGGNPVAYPGYGTLSGVLLQDTGSLPGQNVALGPVATGTLSGTVSVPTGYTELDVSMSLVVAPGITMSFVDDFTAGATFSYLTPSISTLEINATAAAYNSVTGEYSAVIKVGLPPTSTVALQVPAAQTLIAPATSATGVDGGTQFSWTPYPGGVTEFVAAPQSGQTGPTFYILTAATSVDLADAGIPLPSSVNYDWYVVGLAPVSTIDLLANPGGLNMLTIDLNESVSAKRAFTTAP